MLNFANGYSASTLPKATTVLKPEFDLSSNQTLPRSYKVNSDNSVSTKFSPNFRSQSVGELSLENREKGRVQLVLSSDSFVTSTLPRPPKPVRSVLTVQEKLTQDMLIPNYSMKEVVDNFLAENEWAHDY